MRPQRTTLADGPCWCGAEPAYRIPRWNDTLCAGCIRLGHEFDAMADERERVIWRLFWLLEESEKSR